MVVSPKKNVSARAYLRALQNQHVVPNNWNWSVRKWWALKATRTFLTQKEAISYAKGIAKNKKSELFVHWRDWKIRKRNSYWNDPFPPRW